MPKLRVLSGREVLKIHAIYRQAARFIPESELRSKFFTD
jgi:hypothetical protein